MNVMAEYQATLSEKVEIARDTIAFRFATNGAPYEFRAGQHADFAFWNSSEGDQNDNSRTFSLASSPHQRTSITVAMRMRDTGFKIALKRAPLGTRFKVSSPRGSFTLHKDITRPAVFLAGGIGITPMYSILQWATQLRLPHPLYLFFSNRCWEDAGFLKDLENLATQNPCFTLIPTLTRNASPAWRYEKGQIDRGLLMQYLGSLNGPIYYLAGPSGMVASMSAMLRNAGVSDDDVRTEEFGDYKAL
jgi:ferredoxin-NADP reductase